MRTGRKDYIEDSHLLDTLKEQLDVKDLRFPAKRFPALGN